MVHEGTIGAIQIDDRDLSRRFIHPNLGVVARGSRILYKDVICARAADGGLSRF
jgi:hypothetical protein